ncbi:hypothetical protein [Nocardioides sp. URHA0032]|nr:hypothetical protein [Nocardioides sp. URHA0032]
MTGHEVKTDDASADFWRAAGYQDVTEKKAPAKRSASKKSSTTKK